MLKHRALVFLTLFICAVLPSLAKEDKLTYGRFTVSYTHLRYDMHLDVAQELNLAMEGSDKTNGASVDAVVGRIFNANLPFFGEIGLGITYTGNQVSEPIEGLRIGYEILDKFQVCAICIPVNIGFRARCSKTVSIDPYVGLNFKFNAMMREQLTYNSLYLQDHPSAKEEAKWTNMLSDCPSCGMGDKDLTFNKFQLGWHVGVGCNIKRFYIGLSYGTDFMKAWQLDKSHVSSSTVKASIGFTI